MSKKRILSLLLLFCTLFSSIPFGSIGALASGTDEEPKKDAMEEIEPVFTDHKIGDTQTVADDGYIGIPVELSIYFDGANHTVSAGYGGTPIIIYVINTYAERVGTASDAEIIQSMLERGYVVTVLDYKNDKRAVSPALDWSVQGIRNQIKEKKYFTDPIFPSGTYHDNYVVPAGCDVSLYNVFWEADKHGVDGTLDKIVEIWNADFRSVKGEKLVKWVYSDGTRKKTLDKAKDGTAPVWYDESGNTDADGEYTKVKYTVAESITDCVNPDGSFIDLDLYIHIIYPVDPEKPVPIMSLANSSGYMANSVQTADRPHMNGFLFNGYAGVMFDYFYVPMANDNSFGYYDGANSSGSITGDSLTYSVHVYNDKLVNTAAMRYLRYLALSDPETYNFDINAFGVYGNSKGGYMSFLGEKAVQSPLANGSYATLGEKENAIDAAISAFTPFRYLDKHHGETRYQIGEIADYTDHKSGFTVYGGEKQPWITYEGEEIISGAQLTYVGNGADSESVTEGRMPMIVSVHLNDSYNAAYGESNRFANMCRTMNIPSVIFELPLGHTLSYGEDLDYGIDTYDTIFSFVGYYLKKDPISVLYTTPLDRAAGVSVTDRITVKFAGEVSAEEIEKVTVTGGGETLSGVWSSSFGDTEWTFTPYAMKGGVTYSVNVPADLKGKNGLEMGTAYTSTFIAEYDNASADLSTVTAENGTYFSFTAPSAMSMGANGYAIRFYVVNDAANVAELYAVDASTYDPADPDSTTMGELVGKINLKGSGSYEIDVTDYVAERAGEKTVLLLKSQKTAGTAEILYINYESGAGNISKDSYVTATVDTETFDGNAVYKITVGNTKNKYDEDHRFYSGVNTAFTQKNILGENMTADDYGRQFTLSLRIYDTVSRSVQLRYDTCTDRTTYGTRDYDFSIVNLRTKANEWITVELPYTVYDTDYGMVGENNTKDIIVRVGSTGNTETPIYIDDIRVTETVTDVRFGNIVLAEKNDGGIPYKSPESERPIALYNGSTLVGEYDSWNKALSAYKSGYTLKLQSDYTLTDADLYSDFGMNGGAKVSGTLNVFDIDLNGYTLVSGNTVGSILWLKTDSADISRTEINIYGGAILLDRTPLISYGDSSVTDASKIYDVKLTNVYISTVKGAVLTQAISADTVSVGSAVEARISLTGCTIDLPDGKHAKDVIEIFPAGTGSLDIFYLLKGGSIRLSAQKYVTIQTNANVSEYLMDESGEYTKLLLPASRKADSTSYLREDGYAVYAASGETDESGFAIFRLSKSENSTRYGVIDEAYTDADKYPWLVFSDGSFRGAYESLIKASGAVTELVEGTANAKAEAQILLRRDYVNGESGDGFTGLNVIGGTVIIDLGGFTFTRNGSFLDFKSNTVAAPYDNTVIIRNGAIRTMKAAPCDFQYTADQVVDKTFNITIENVTFGLADECKEGTSMELIWVVWDNKRDNVACNANITMNDCVIDLDTNAEKFKDYTSITLFKFYDTYDRVNVALTVNGGRIIAPDMSHVTFMKGNAGSDTVTMGRGSDGKFMTAALTGEGKVIGDNFVTVDGENRSFTKVSGSEGEYELGINELVTKYGVIPTAYGDAEAYPFVLFFDGKFVGAYSIWGNSSTTDNVDVLDAAKDLIKGTDGAGKTAFILMRRDYLMTDDVYYNLSQVGGTVYLDLGGNTFYVGKNDMFYAEGKTNYDTALTVVNGSIRTAGAGSTVEMRHSAALTGSTKKTFHITFEGVTFGIAAKSTVAQPLLYSVNGQGTQCYFDIVMNGCTFDYATEKPTSKITLFHLASSTDTNYVDLTVNGGTFMLDGFSDVTFQKTTSNDTVTFGRGNDGEYPVIRTLSTASPLNTVFDTSEGKAVFIEESDDGTDSVYRLTPVPYTTENMSSYSDSFFSGVDYPFAVFIDGKLAENGLKAYLGQAFQRARELTANGSATVQIMLRADHVTDSDKDKTDSYLKHVNGTVVLDLSGHTLTRGAQYILNLGLGDDCLYKTTVIVKNGTIHNSRYVVGISNNGSTAGAKEYDILFDNVVIDYKKLEGRELGSIFMAWTQKTGAGASIKLAFNDCTLDLRGAPAGTPVFACKDLSTNGLVNVDTVISGGDIFAVDLSQITLLEGDSAGGDTIRFAPDGNGEYTVLTQSSSSPYPTMSFQTLSGDTVSFRQVRNVGVNTVYALDSDIKTKYGYIPNMYSNAETYPFAVFMDGRFIGAYSVWGESSDKEESTLGAVKNAALGALAAGKTVYILMRRDYTVLPSDLYYNLSQMGGTLIFDMNGYTMTAEYEVFVATAKATSNVVHSSEYVIKNGKFIVDTASIIKFNDVNNENYNIAKVMKFRFEDVTFQLAEGYTVSNMICYTANAGYVGSLPQLIFTDCIFDLSALGSKSVTLINLKDNRNIITGNVTFEGGKIIANTEKGWSISSVNSGKDLVAFEPDGEGKYTEFTVSVGYVFRNSAGEKLDLISANGTYTLIPHAHGYSTSTVDPTCTEKGYTEHVCSCGDSYVDNYTDALGHAYDNDCDADCNVCGVTRLIQHIGGSATCTAKAKCDNCGKEYGELAEHTPNADDGDCTTAITCTECGTVTTAGKPNHTPGADDGDCTTAITCTECDMDALIAQASHTDLDTNDKCDVCGKDMSNTPDDDPGDDPDDDLGDEPGNTPGDEPDDDPGDEPENEDPGSGDTDVSDDDSDGLGAGVVAGIVIGVAVVGCGGFAIVWFVIKKKH